MPVPFFKEIKIGAYLVKQKLMGRKRYPLVLMLEPLFRCNLACSGCGKIDYPDAILNRRLSVQECLDAVDECGAGEGLRRQCQRYDLRQSPGRGHCGVPRLREEPRRRRLDFTRLRL